MFIMADGRSLTFEVRVKEQLPETEKKSLQELDTGKGYVLFLNQQAVEIVSYFKPGYFQMVAQSTVKSYCRSDPGNEIGAIQLVSSRCQVQLLDVML